MKKFYLLIFALFALVACEVKNPDNESFEPKNEDVNFVEDDEPFEPMAEDFIEIQFPNPFGDVGITKERAEQIVVEYLDGINPNFSVGEVCVSSGFAGGFFYFFEIFYKGIIIENHRLTLYYNDFEGTTVSLYGESLFYNDISVVPVLTEVEAKCKLNQIISGGVASEGELLIYKEIAKAPNLCYKFVVEHYYYYVSAKTGELIAKKQNF